MYASRLRTKLVGAVLAVLMTSTIAACGGDGTTTSADGKELKEFNLMYFPIPLSITELAAKEQGFFEDEGLDVRLINATSGADAVKFIVAGSAYGELGSNALNLQAIDAGQPLIELGSIANINPMEVTVREGLGLPMDGTLTEKIQALKGMRVGVTGIGAATHIVAEALMRAGGMENPADEVEFVAVGLTTTAVQQLKAGRIDAYVAPAPFGPIARDAAAGVTYIDADDFPDSMQPAAWLTLTTTQEQYDKDPEIAKAWCRAEIKGVEFVTNPANRQEVESLMGTILTGQSEAVVKETTDYYVEWFDSARDDWSVPEDAFENDLALIEGAGLQNKGDLDYDTVVKNVC